MVLDAKYTGFALAPWFILVGAGLGRRYGFLGILGGELSGAVMGFCSGYVFSLIADALNSFLDRYSHAHPFLGPVLRWSYVIVSLVLLAACTIGTFRLIFL
jgi:hypothetical protein